MMNAGNEAIEHIQYDAQSNSGDIWSALLGGVEGAAGWLFEAGQGNADQHRQFGSQLLDRAAEYSQRLMILADGVGNSVERAHLIESAQRTSTYVDEMRASGAEAIENAGRAAATAARNARLGAISGTAGVAVDGYQYIRDLHAAIGDGNWTKFGETAASMGAGAAGGAWAAGIAIGALAAIASVIVVPAGIAAGTAFVFGFGGAFIGAAFGSKIYEGWRGIADLVASQFLAAASTRPNPIYRDPLALDLDGDGIETIGINVNGQPITFDHNADGVRTGTGWVRADDAWLVLDRNANGTIDTGRELFGVDTLKASGQYATSGLDALRDLDSNLHSVFNASDAAFTQVQLWRDVNQDGISQAGELFSLADQGIASISLRGTSTNTNLNNGNTLGNTATFTRTDRTTTLAADLNLTHSPFYRSFTSPVPLSEQALAPPQMAGAGWVRDLREHISSALEIFNGLDVAQADMQNPALGTLGLRDVNEQLRQSVNGALAMQTRPTPCLDATLIALMIDESGIHFDTDVDAGNEAEWRIRA